MRFKILVFTIHLENIPDLIYIYFKIIYRTLFKKYIHLENILDLIYIYMYFKIIEHFSKSFSPDKHALSAQTLGLYTEGCRVVRGTDYVRHSQ